MSEQNTHSVDIAAATQQAHVLAQALPFLRRYAGATVVVKYGGHAMGEEHLAQSFGSGKVTAGEVARSLIGAVAKEGEDDLKVMREYCETVAKGRSGAWKEFYGAAKASLRS